MALLASCHWKHTHYKCWLMWWQAKKEARHGGLALASGKTPFRQKYLKGEAWLSRHLDILTEAGGWRDRQALLPEAFEMKGDRLTYELLHLVQRLAGGEAARYVGDIGRTLPTTEAAELRTALALVLLASLDELLHARQLLLALRDLLTGLALARLALHVGRVHLLLELLHLLLHLREEFGITVHTGRGRDGERDHDG
jgi:hypothetical protein